MLKDLFLLDPEVIFLNHGSFGACPCVVFEKYQAWQTRLERQPVQFLGQELDQYLRESRQALGEYLNAPAKDLVYITNATHGVNIITHSLILKPGDEVLSTDQEYGACDFAWEHACHKAGAVYKHQAVRMPIRNADEIVDQFWQAVTPRTRVIFLSHITSPTALAIPVTLICQRARQAGILTVIDGAHAPGQIDLDLPAYHADFYVGNCHKWMLSPKGAGFLYASPEAQDLIEPLIVSWGYQSETSAPRESRFVDLLQWTGTRDPAAALTVPAAIEFMQANHWEEVRVSCHSLLRRAMEQICDQTGTTSLYPPDADFYYQMGTIPIPRVRDLKELKSQLYNDYKIEIPCFEWNKQHFIRLSVQGYNSEDDIESLCQALASLLPDMVQ